MESGSGLRQPLAKNGKVIITGPGRSGTTFLVCLFTELGYDTGFTLEQCRSLDPISRAGLEMGIYKYPHKSSPLSDPYVIKSPLISELLRDACRRGDVCIEHVFIPVRDLREVAMSRERVSLAGGEGGGFWGADSVDEQESRTAKSLYVLVDTCLKFELPFTLLSFPRLVQDPEYLYGKLSYMLGGIGFDDFEKIFACVARPGWVTKF